MADCGVQPTTPFKRPGFWRKPGFGCACVALGTALVIAAHPQPATAQADTAQADEEDRPQYRAGLIAQYTGSDGKTHRRVDELLSFVWGKQPPDPRMPAGDFSARWTGRLFSIAPGEYRLYVYAAGAVRITLEKQVLLDTRTDRAGWLSATRTKLTYGHHPLEVEFRKTADEPRVALYWQGPKFGLEPVPTWHLFHDPPATPSQQFVEGQRLAHVLRCVACHDTAAGLSKPLPAPALTRLAGNIDRAWLASWIQHAGRDAAAAEATLPASRMPVVGLSREEAAAITEYLLVNSEKPAHVGESLRDSPSRLGETRPRADGRTSPKSKPTAPSPAVGRELFMTLGCLACHQAEKLGRGGLFGGGDLSRVAEKRPADFFARWLAEPAELNPDHRMPVFPLTPQERLDLAAYLSSLKGPPMRGKTAPLDPKTADKGRDLLARHRCDRCHQVPGVRRPGDAGTPLVRLDRNSRWSAGCSGEPNSAKARPGYRLAEPLQTALREYFTSLAPRSSTGEPRPADLPRHVEPTLILAERNCLGCHARGNTDEFAGLLPAVVAARPQLAPSLSALKPPALHGIGDKFHEQALRDAILTKHAPLRPWLRVRMPRFGPSDDEMASLVKHLTDTDRVPAGGDALAVGSGLNREAPSDAALRVAGARLVTSDGFGCTSCHQIGRAMPERDEIRSRGPDLAMLGRRVRREWYDRFTPDPARIVPNMEMPSLVAPVRGVLGDRLEDQLAAVWHVLDQPDFHPPLPGAVRVVRCRNAPGEKERANVLTDVLKVGERVYVKPLVIGLSNRHNLLFDLETGSLAGWWVGDTARQYTRGKSWHWEPGGTQVIAFGQADSEMKRFANQGRTLHAPLRQGQFLTELDAWEHVEGGGVRFTYRLRFREGTGLDHMIPITQTILPLVGAADKTGAPRSGFIRRIEIDRRRLEFDYRLLPLGSVKDAPIWSVRFGGDDDDLKGLPRAAKTDSIQLESRRRLIAWPGSAKSSWIMSRPCPSIHCRCRPQKPGFRAKPGFFPRRSSNVVPGYEARRLPLPEDIMPTGLAWREDGTLVISDLKGRVLLARDSNGDGVEDTLTTLADGLAAPYGVAAQDWRGGRDSQTRAAALARHGS